MTLKAKYNDYKTAEAISDAASELWYADPENEELEAIADAAYSEMWNALQAFAAEMVRFTSGQVDAKTAIRMAMCPKFSDRLDDLMNRWAA